MKTIGRVLLAILATPVLILTGFAIGAFAFLTIVFDVVTTCVQEIITGKQYY